MDPIDQAAESAEREITEAFEQFYSGKPARVPYVGCGMGATLGMQYQPVADAITDILSDGTSKAALMVLLQGITDVAAFRKVLIADYIDQHVADIAQQRAIFDAPQVYSFLMTEAA
jgi:hypothetical protein